MINSNLLADRLNAFKNGEALPESQNNIATSEKWITFLAFCMQGAIELCKALIYGYGLFFLLEKDWTFIQIAVIGSAISLVATPIITLLTKITYGQRKTDSSRRD